MFDCLDIKNLKNKKVSLVNEIDYNLLENSTYDIKIFDNDTKDQSKSFDLIYNVLNQNEDIEFYRVDINENDNKIYFYYQGDFKELDFIDLNKVSTNQAFLKLKTFNLKNEDSYSLKEISIAVQEYCKYYRKLFKNIKNSFENDTKEFELVLNYIKVRSVKLSENFKTVIDFRIMRKGYGEGISKKYFHSSYLFDINTKQFIKEETEEETFYNNKKIIPFFYKYVDKIVDIYNETHINDTLHMNINLSDNFSFELDYCLFKNEEYFSEDSSSLNFFKSNFFKINCNNKIIHFLSKNSIIIESLDYDFTKNIMDMGGPEKVYETIFISKDLINKKFYKYLPERKELHMNDICEQNNIYEETEFQKNKETQSTIFRNFLKSFKEYFKKF